MIPVGRTIGICKESPRPKPRQRANFPHLWPMPAASLPTLEQHLEARLLELDKLPWFQTWPIKARRVAWLSCAVMGISIVAAGGARPGR